ncbi:MAG: hypothetical protein WC796_01775 [Candidatus Pacearchaeota archaeon]|jgi:hypothetical protein
MKKQGAVSRKKDKTGKTEVAKKILLLLLGVFLLILLVFSIRPLFNFNSTQFTGSVINPTNLDDPIGVGISASDLSDSNLIKDKAQLKWEYLQQEWKKAFLENRVIKGLDYFFTEISFVFRILFGESYSFSFLLFLVIVVWIIVLIIVKSFIKSFFNFPLGVCYLVGVLVAIVFAQLNLLKIIVTWILWLIFSQEAWYMRFFMILVVIGAVIAVVFVIKIIQKEAEASKKRDRENKNEKNMKKIDSFVKKSGI